MIVDNALSSNDTNRHTIGDASINALSRANLISTLWIVSANVFGK